MDSAVKIFGGMTLFFGGMFLLIIAGTLMGALAGWAVGLFFNDTILGIAAQLGIRDVAMWQLGAFLGFIGGFLKTKVSAEVRSK